MRLGAGSFEASHPVQSYLSHTIFEVDLKKPNPTQSFIYAEKDTLADLWGS